MDLTPFKRINPCGLANIKMTQWRDFVAVEDIFALATPLLTYIKQFCYGDKAYVESIYR